MKFTRLFILITFSLIFLACSGGRDDVGGGGTPLPIPPTIIYTDTELIEMAKKDVLKYFWDYSESNSKLARERYHTDDPGNDADIVTMGGSGFGLMTILVGVEKGYVPRAEAVSRLTTAMDFLEKADRFHGAWPHWLYGGSAKIKPFSQYDDGADLVETSFLAQGLICVREYFKNGSTEEKTLATKADQLWKGIEYNWFTKGRDPQETEQNALYWHWSPNYGWKINFKLEGYNETMITYILAAASPNYSPDNIAQAYRQGWLKNGAIKSSVIKNGVEVIVNHNGANGNVGPMFFSHYSFLGLDPRGLYDEFVNWGNVAQNHTKIMYQYCVSNPKSFAGYSTKNWGLTASYTRNVDGTTGYRVHQPNNNDDVGVISPTAALSSFPFSPVESMNYLRFLYNEKKSKYVGVAGPYDAYSDHYNWVTPRYLAIDQGTIVPMIENQQTGFIWKLFMNAPDVKQGLIKLGFHSTQYGF